MSILIDKDTRVITQGITGKTGQFHTRGCRDYANGKACFVAGVNPKRAGEDFEGIPIYASVADAKAKTGATVSVIYVPGRPALPTRSGKPWRLSSISWCVSPRAFRCATC
jgi:succinyl-CoA synthetase alpha subunit